VRDTAADAAAETALYVLSDAELFGWTKPRARRLTQPRAMAPEAFFADVSPGDFVVHMEHGIGQFMGLVRLPAEEGSPREYLQVDYAMGDKLYVPVHQADRLSRYVGVSDHSPRVNRLGTAEWQQVKTKAKRAVEEIAGDLLTLYASREVVAGHAFGVDTLWQAELEASFPYIETEDQLRAIEEIKADMEQAKPMDRLVCGDVGYGKTEVAIRAAFKAVLEGKQVAVLAPTTILAEQHLETFSRRMAGFPVELKMLSRFVPPPEQRTVLSGLADGTVDIVIGTHALIQDGIQFSSLGVVVVDEQHRFGVAQRVTLRDKGGGVVPHLLVMTATPIPRTLQLSLSGVRDLSIIGTPPVDRLSIRTYVSEFDSVTIREALLREHYRGGQSFYVVPRIKDLPEIEEFLKTQVPEVSYVIAHGQMAAGELDDRMNAFYDGKYDVLLATTIIESGLDIPTANTMIIHRADMYGLAQLYQIRGRVGRSKTRAYAYLTTKPRAKLTPQAEKRLRVLGSLDSLGAGFTLASQDLDIRGAGNLLGEEQSGNVREVGYELYQSMLEEAITRIKSGELEGLSEPDGQWSPNINLGVSVLIPEDYVPDLDVRLGLYRRLSGLTTKVELEGFAAELIDRFGKLPKEVNTLLLVVRIKAECKKAHTARLDTGPKGATIQFHMDKFANPAGLVEFIQDQKGLAKVKDNKIVVRRDWDKESDKIKGAFAIARDLAEKAKAAPTARAV